MRSQACRLAGCSLPRTGHRESRMAKRRAIRVSILEKNEYLFGCLHSE